MGIWIAEGDDVSGLKKMERVYIGGGKGGPRQPREKPKRIRPDETRQPALRRRSVQAPMKKGETREPEGRESHTATRGRHT